jgi:phosphatidylinositol alpha-1,6-mannosyltransferase
MRLLAFVTDAFGGRGGIAKFNRDLLAALCTASENFVVAVPRVVRDDVGEIPARLEYRIEGAGSKLRFVRCGIEAALGSRFDGVVCGHIHLLPIAALAARLHRVPLLLIVHGVEAWKPPKRGFERWLVRHANAIVAVSEFTKRRVLEWAGISADTIRVIPNCVDLTRYGSGPKRPDLLQRYGLEDRRIMLTVCRLASSERYKGVDEVIHVLPQLLGQDPSLAYLVVGEGDDIPRLRSQARRLGVEDRVVFTGHVDESEKADHFRLADVFVMPGRGEGFGIVYLEALACGVPVVASSADASREAVRGGMLGEVVDPDDPKAIVDGILKALLGTPPDIREQLQYFSAERFQSRWLGAAELVFAQGHATKAEAVPAKRLT